MRSLSLWLSSRHFLLLQFSCYSKTYPRGVQFHSCTFLSFLNVSRSTDSLWVKFKIWTTLLQPPKSGCPSGIQNKTSITLSISFSTWTRSDLYTRVQWKIAFGEKNSSPWESLKNIGTFLSFIYLRCCWALVIKEAKILGWATITNLAFLSLCALFICSQLFKHNRY